MAPPLSIPRHVRDVLELLWRSGHAAYAVGGSVRDALLGLQAKDWDVATDALPERILELLPTGRYENRFGTVTVAGVEVTTFRRDHRYRDHRRPDTVTFSTSLEEDLARRDFTVNAIAYGLPATSLPETGLPATGLPETGRPETGLPATGDGTAAAADPGDDDSSRQAAWVDPTGGTQDLANRMLRAVGDPAARFDEDALRLLRGARLAARLGFTVEPATRAAMAAAAPTASHLSAERVGRELRLMLAIEAPSAALRLLDDLGLLEPTLPVLAAQRGIAQNKSNGLDLWGHTLATLDAAASMEPGDEVLLLAALLHDAGKPETRTELGFHGHDTAGAVVAEQLLTRMAFPRPDVERVRELVRWHMFSYEASWSDAAVRRFIRRVGPDVLPRLFALRRADNIGSGLSAEAGRQLELEARVERELERHVPLSLGELAVDGDDLQRDAGIPAGPGLGEILERLLDSVVSDPERNDRDRLLTDARNWWAETHREGATAARRRVPAGDRGR